MSDDIKLNGQCEHGYPADGTCPYCHPAKDRPAKHGNDDIKQAAEHCLRNDNCHGCPGINTRCTRTLARAYLALREQVETVALPALLVARNAMKNRRASATWGEGSTRHMNNQDAQIDAAIKAIEEGRG